MVEYGIDIDTCGTGYTLPWGTYLYWYWTGTVPGHRYRVPQVILPTLFWGYEYPRSRPHFDHRGISPSLLFGSSFLKTFK